MARRAAVALVGSVVLAGLSWSTVRAEPEPPDAEDGPSVYTGVLDADALTALLASGVDRHEVEVAASEAGQFEVEAILSAAQADQLAELGADLEPQDSTSARRTTAQAVPVFRPYSGPGGLQEELAAQAAAHPSIAKLEVVGQTIEGKTINAVRVTRNVARTTPGRRPTTVYVAAQHAREWITPEMVRRLLDHILAGYGKNAEITQLVNNNELWFIPVANPDGYDFSFTPGRRLWRKNTRDNNGDGRVTGVDGVDLNRNYPTRWGYDNEGSSPNSTSDTYRGTGPASEPETQALDALFARITPEFFVNYHSAAELLLHGIGWQVATPSPDDVLYQAMVGDDANPAVPGYDPDIAAELYTVNGDTDSHMQEAHGALGFTPEMSTCEAASNSVPDDEWEARRLCDSGFDFPDDEDLVQAEFEKNIPFALAVAKSAKDPDDPVSVVGIDTPNFVVDSFDVSYGDPQTVAVTAKRHLFLPLMNYRINGGRRHIRFAGEWDGGERYGFENVDYYSELRADVRGADPGDEVEVWFTAISLDVDEFGWVESERFTYTVASDTDSPGADHRQRGLHRRQPDVPGIPGRPTEVRRRARRRAAGQRDHTRCLGRRRPGRAARPRRAQPLRRRRLVLRRQPPDPGPGGLPDGPRRRRRVRGRLGRGTPAVPHDRRARLPQRGRQARARRRDRRLPRPVRRPAGRHLLRPRRGARGGMLHPAGRRPVQRLPAAGRRLHAVLPRCVQPGGTQCRRCHRPRRWTARWARCRVRRAGDSRQPGRRGRRVHRHERRVASRRVPAVRQRACRGVRVARGAAVRRGGRVGGRLVARRRQLHATRAHLRPHRRSRQPMRRRSRCRSPTTPRRATTT